MSIYLSTGQGLKRNYARRNKAALGLWRQGETSLKIKDPIKPPVNFHQCQYFLCSRMFRKHILYTKQ
jgi:hypothetical protein